MYNFLKRIFIGRRSITLFTLGNIQERIFPGPESTQKLAAMLKEGKNKTDLQLIWGPELTIKKIDY